MPEKVTFINERGESTQSDIVSVFKVNNKKIMITTNNEVDPNGLTVLNVSEVNGDKLTTISNDSDWDAIKNIMRSIISGTDATKVEYEPLLSIANINTTNSFRYISVSNSAVSAMVNDYSTNKPVGDASATEPLVSITNAPPANAFNNLEGDLQGSNLPENNAIYPQQSAITNSNAIPVANGINMVPPPIMPIQNQVNFEPVQDLASPVDLIGSSQANNFIPSQNEIPNQDMNNINMSFNTITENSSLEEIRKIAIDNISAIITNYVDAIAQKEMEAANQLKLQNEQKQQELLAQEELIKTKLMGMQSNPYNFQQPIQQMPPNMNMGNNGVSMQPQMQMGMPGMGMQPNPYNYQQPMPQNQPDMNMNGVVGQPQMGMPMAPIDMNQGMSQNMNQNMYQSPGMNPGMPNMNMMNNNMVQDQTAA